MDCSPPGSAVHGVLQERILEWAAIPNSGSELNQGLLQTDSLPWATREAQLISIYALICEERQYI